MSKVVKFGGSSLADATQFQKVYDIIQSDKERRFVFAIPFAGRGGLPGCGGDHCQPSGRDHQLL